MSSNGDLSHDSVLDDLKTVLVRKSEGRLAPDLIDPRLEMFECGYIDSLTSVDFLQHVEKAYGVVIQEVQLIGKLASLDAVARHILDSRAG